MMEALLKVRWKIAHRYVVTITCPLTGETGEFHPTRVHTQDTTTTECFTVPLANRDDGLLQPLTKTAVLVEIHSIKEAKTQLKRGTCSQPQRHKPINSDPVHRQECQAQRGERYRS